MPAFRDLTKQRFNLLVVLHFSHKKNGHAYWACQCDCGGKIVTSRGQLVTKGTRSCGCLRRETARKHMLEMDKTGENNPAYKHGMRRTKFYNTWYNIIAAEIR